MKYKKFNNNYILRIDKGEEIVESLFEFIKIEKIKLANVSGIGASNHIEMGLFDTKEKKYYSKVFKGDFEITSLLGNISTMDDKPYLHLHISLANKDQKMFGGHLNKAIISGTLELFITAIDNKIDRKFDNDVGLNLLEFKND
ncbi:MAG: PPC domain-containing DNA-binding protein [bacterium]